MESSIQCCCQIPPAGLLYSDGIQEDVRNLKAIRGIWKKGSRFWAFDASRRKRSAGWMERASAIRKTKSIEGDALPASSLQNRSSFYIWFLLQPFFEIKYLP